MNLFMFPFAGGDARSYKDLKPRVTSLNCNALDIPGRGKRACEPLLVTIEDMTADLMRQLEGKLSEPYALFGHSMGATLAFMLSREISARGLPPPLCLFLSGRNGPGAPDPDNERYLLPSAEFLEMLKELGGFPDELLENADLMEYYEPILRADFRAVETFVYPSPRKPIDVPIVVLIGDKDTVSMDDAMAWGRETRSSLNVQRFTGGHFFIFDHWRSIGELIVNELKQAGWREGLAAPIIAGQNLNVELSHG